MTLFDQSKFRSRVSKFYIEKSETLMEDYLGKGEIIKYELLFSSDSSNENEFHNIEAIHRQSNTLTIIFTKLGSVIGCFSSMSHCGNFDGQ